MFFILVPFHCRLFFTYDVVLGGLLLCFPESPPLKSNSVPDRLKALNFLHHLFEVFDILNGAILTSLGRDFTVMQDHKLLTFICKPGF